MSIKNGGPASQDWLAKEYSIFSLLAEGVHSAIPKIQLVSRHNDLCFGLCILLWPLQWPIMMLKLDTVVTQL